MKILITGNLGYIGPELTKYIKTKYHNSYIVGYDIGWFVNSLSCLDNRKFSDLNLNEQHYGDIRNINEKIFDGVDVVVMLAAVSNDPIGNEFIDVTKDINYSANAYIANLIIKKRIKNLIFASSCSVYGFADGNPKSESDALNPITEYAKSKIDLENYETK